MRICVHLEASTHAICGPMLRERARARIHVSSRKVKQLTFDGCKRLEKVRVYFVSHTGDSAGTFWRYAQRLLSEMIKRNVRIFLANNLR